MEESDERMIVANQAIPAARALEVCKSLFADPEGRRMYSESPDKVGAFNDWKQRLEEPALREANYGDIPAASRRVLEEALEEHLEFLSRLDETFVKDGLFVEVPSPGFLMFH
jgi:hypothetical protein